MKVNAIASDMPIGDLDRSLRCPWVWRYQEPAAWLYKHTVTEISVACLIAGNFLCNIIEATVDPHGTLYTGVLTAFELFFNICFTLELSVNMYAFWCKPFWKSGWNIFDLVVVSIGLLTTMNLDLGPLSLLRMMRAFRVFRLFKRVRSLRQIGGALINAIPGVTNAFLILLIVMCIYAIIGCEVFIDFGEGGYFINIDGNETELLTGRGQEYGYEYFGNFPKSLYTMLQILTGDSWSEGLARPAMETPSLLSRIAVAFFYVTFVILNVIVLINVVVAVLLEKLLGPGGAVSEEAGVDDNDKPLLPLIEVMGDRDSCSWEPEPAKTEAHHSPSTVTRFCQEPEDTDEEDEEEAEVRAEIEFLRTDVADLRRQLGLLSAVLQARKVDPNHLDVASNYAKSEYAKSDITLT